MSLLTYRLLVFTNEDIQGVTLAVHVQYVGNYSLHLTQPILASEMDR